MSFEAVGYLGKPSSDEGGLRFAPVLREDKLQVAPVVSSLLGAGAGHGAVDTDTRNPWQIGNLFLVLENPFA